MGWFHWKQNYGQRRTVAVLRQNWLEALVPLDSPEPELYSHALHRQSYWLADCPDSTLSRCMAGRRWQEVVTTWPSKAHNGGRLKEGTVSMSAGIYNSNFLGSSRRTKEGKEMILLLGREGCGVSRGNHIQNSRSIGSHRNPKVK